MPGLDLPPPTSALQAILGWGEEAGAPWQVDLPGPLGLTPLHLAAAVPTSPTASALLEALLLRCAGGAVAGAAAWHTARTADGLTPAQFAAMAGSAAAAEAVLRRLAPALVVAADEAGVAAAAAPEAATAAGGGGLGAAGEAEGQGKAEAGASNTKKGEERRRPTPEPCSPVRQPPTPRRCRCAEARRLAAACSRTQLLAMCAMRSSRGGAATAAGALDTDALCSCAVPQPPHTLPVPTCAAAGAPATVPALGRVSPAPGAPRLTAPGAWRQAAKAAAAARAAAEMCAAWRAANASAAVAVPAAQAAGRAGARAAQVMAVAVAQQGLAAGALGAAAVAAAAAGQRGKAPAARAAAQAAGRPATAAGPAVARARLAPRHPEAGRIGAAWPGALPSGPVPRPGWCGAGRRRLGAGPSCSTTVCMPCRQACSSASMWGLRPCADDLAQLGAVASGWRLRPEGRIQRVMELVLWLAQCRGLPRRLRSDPDASLRGSQEFLSLYPSLGVLQPHFALVHLL